MRSKAHWGYSAEFMEACRQELAVSESKLSNKHFHYAVAENQGEIVGYYALERLSGEEFELEALFVEPKHIGSGVGRALIGHAKNRAAANGGRTLIIQGDPHAEKFYRAAGGKRTGERESASIPGRFLPVFSIFVGYGVGLKPDLQADLHASGIFYLVELGVGLKPDLQANL